MYRTNAQAIIRELHASATWHAHQELEAIARGDSHRAMQHFEMQIAARQQAEAIRQREDQ